MTDDLKKAHAAANALKGHLIKASLSSAVEYLLFERLCTKAERIERDIAKLLAARESL